MANRGRAFLGVGFKFPFSFSSSGGLSKLVGTSVTSDVDRINNSLAHIFSVTKGERPMRRSFGSRLREINFMPNDDRLDLWVEMYVTEAIDEWEPRIIFLNVEVDHTRRKEGVLEIDIRYRIIQTNVEGNYVFPFYLNFRDQVPIN